MTDLTNDGEEAGDKDKHPTAGGSADESQSEYEVGYCKPPVSGQFPKGNKKGGRKKGSKGLKTLVNEAFDAKAPAKINGKTQKVAKKALALHQLANKASSGDMKAIEKAIPLLERYGPQEDADGSSLKHLKPDMEALRAYLRWYDFIYASDNDNDGYDDVDDDREEREANG